MLDLTKPIQTKSGKPARIICTDYRDSSPLIALIDFDRSGEVIATFTSDGKYYEDGTENENDLINVQALSINQAKKREIVDFKVLPESDSLNPAIIALSDDKKLYMLKSPGSRTSVAWEELPELPQD